MSVINVVMEHIFMYFKGSTGSVGPSGPKGSSGDKVDKYTLLKDVAAIVYYYVQILNRDKKEVWGQEVLKELMEIL